MRVLCVSVEERNDLLAAALLNTDLVVDLIRGPALAITALASAAYAAVIVQLRSLDVPPQIVRNLRCSTDVPILVLGTTRADAVACLDAGADDYLPSPFEPEELGARLRAAWRRHDGRCTSTMVHADLSMDVAKHEVRRSGVHIELTAREFAVLEHLMRHAGAVVPAHRIGDTLYGWGEKISSNTIQVYVHKLRRKLGADAIRCVRGAGYAVAQTEE